MGRFSLALVGAALVLAGCGGQPGSEYLGKWEREKTVVNSPDWKQVDRETLTIDRNGDGYMLRSVHVIVNNKEQTTLTPQNTPAIFKDGQLQLHGGLVSYTIDRASGHLVPPDGAGEYTRVK